jgi:hypothetical protein
MVITMPSRSSRKPAPQAAPARQQSTTYFPGWTSGPAFSGYLLQPASAIDHEKIRVHVQGRALTVSLGSADAGTALSGYAFQKGSGRHLEPVAAPHHRFILPDKVYAKRAKAAWCGNTLIVRFPCTDVKQPATIPPIIEPDIAPAPVISIAVDFGSPVTPIISPPASTHEPPMLDQAKSFIQDGVRYFPLSAAAPVVQAPAPSILHWIKSQTAFSGRPLQSFYFAPGNQYLISEESIERAASRFIKWPSEEPAGPVVLGEKSDQSGYIGLTEAAKTLGVDHHTIWRWTTKGTAPTDRPLDVIKDPASDQLYIRQKDLAALKQIVPRSGLRPGRRPQNVLEPR